MYPTMEMRGVEPISGKKRWVKTKVITQDHNSPKPDSSSVSTKQPSISRFPSYSHGENEQLVGEDIASLRWHLYPAVSHKCVSIARKVEEIEKNFRQRGKYIPWTPVCICHSAFKKCLEIIWYFWIVVCKKRMWNEVWDYHRISKCSDSRNVEHTL
jgi:hypothetical protein